MNYTDKNKLIDSLCGIGLMLLLVEVFYGIVDSAFTIYNYNYPTVTKWINVFGIIFLLAAIITFIRAYKKDSMSTGMYGIELTVLAISAALLPGTYLEFAFPFNKLNVVFPIGFLIYYIIKLIVVFVKAKEKDNKSKGKKK